MKLQDESLPRQNTPRGEFVTEDPSLQVSSLRPIRERVGLIVDGSNAAVVVKTIAAAEAQSKAQDRRNNNRGGFGKRILKCIQRNPK